MDVINRADLLLSQSPPAEREIELLSLSITASQFLQQPRLTVNRLERYLVLKQSVNNIAHSIYPDYNANTLPVAWPSSEESLINYPKYGPEGIPSIKNPEFEIGFGLKTFLKEKPSPNPSLLST